MRTRRAIVLALLVTLPGGVVLARRADAATAACTAADIYAHDSNCPSGTGPCTISKDFTIGDGCTLDFGTRAVTIKGGTIIDIATGTVTIKAGTLTIAGGGYINGRGDDVPPRDRGGFITIITTGAVAVQKTGSLGKIDVGGNVNAGTMRITAGGTVTLDGRLSADGLQPTAGGGEIVIDTGADFITHLASILSAISGTGVSGSIDVRATGRIDLGEQVDLTGAGDGGSLDLNSGADTVVRKVLGDPSGTSDGGSGACLSVSAGTQLQVLGQLLARATTSTDGTSGGCGGMVDLEARFGDLTIASDVLAEGASPDGAGGAVSLTATGSIIVQSPAIISANGGRAGCGGDLCATAGQAITQAGTMKVYGGGGGGSMDILASGAITLNGVLTATADNDVTQGGTIQVDAGSDGFGTLTINGTLDAGGGNCDSLGNCGSGGLVDVTGCDVTVAPSGMVANHGGSGGPTLLTAREQLTVNGTLNATKNAGPGSDGTNTLRYPSRKPAMVGGVVVPAAILASRPTCTAANTPATCIDPCPTCGNGVREYPETCDQAGTPVSCDGCSMFCRVEDCNDQNACTTDSCSPTLGCRNVALPNGTSCSDGLVCNGTEQCSGGVCTAAPLNCNDNNSCTIDTCVEPTGCQHANAPLGAGCSDGDACTVGDTCNATGVCQPGAPAVCNDNRECTNDTCNSSTGCVFSNRSGGCTDDGNQCTSDVCNAGNCTHPIRLNGMACDDGAFCTVSDTCQGGQCTAGPARNCADTNPCTVDSCNETTDQCDHNPAGAGTPCTDNNACTVNDTCDGAGSCQPGAPANCDDGNECTNDSCDTVAGCVHVNRGGSCTNDGNPCTSDVCSAGACTHPNLANGTVCDDFAFCTVGDTCQNGSCTPGPARNCSDNNPCTTDSCNESLDRCDNVPVPTGAACSDGNACTAGDSCDAGGICQPGPPLNCDDGKECTDDSCNPATGCQHVNRSGSCTDDGNACTADVCSGDTCTHQTAPREGAACTDGLFCTVGDRCVAGTCTPTGPRDCSDPNSCTTDSCNEATDTCDHVFVSTGTPCSDGNACTSGDSCDVNGVCQPGPLVNCNDNNPCSDEMCNPLTGCQYTNHAGACPDEGNSCTTDTCVNMVCTHTPLADNTACSDGLFCTVGDRCVSGACAPTGARSCNDNNACTTDTCSETLGSCVQTPIHPCCGDGNTEGTEQCDDGNNVDTDACLNNCRAAVCGDGVVRTGFEECDQGNANSDAPDAACRTDCRARRCGDGIVDTQAGEQCDDGNATAGDGCSSRCLIEPPLTAQRVPGKASSASECILEWAVDRPALDKNGRPASKQSCVNGDPACDFGTGTQDCVFHVWLCSNNHDARLQFCTPGPGGVGTVATIDVTKPSTKSAAVHAEDASNRSEIIREAGHVTGNTYDNCSGRMSIRVPLKAPGLKGSKSGGVRGTTGGLLKDTDSLKLVCLP